MNSSKNPAASVRQKLLNLSRQQKRDYQLLLRRYGMERFLYRLCKSPYAENFILKGALLFLVWDESTSRPTRDADFLGRGKNTPSHLKDLFRDICTVEVEEDGVVFLPATVDAIVIKEEQEYEGVRITFEGRLGKARIPMQIDIGFGDAVTPGVEVIKFPTLIGSGTPTLQAYPRETVIAEKFQAMVHLGITNSRMKDFYDIWRISKEFAFKGEVLARAISNTFEARKTTIPAEIPFVFTPEFYEDRDKQLQWKAFTKKNNLNQDQTEIPLVDVIKHITIFLLPIIKDPQGKKTFYKNWNPSTGWS